MKKLIIYISAVVLVLLLIGGGLYALTMTGGEEVESNDYPTISSYMEDTIDLDSGGEVAIEGDSIRYFPITPNGTDMIIISELMVSISWSDDEVPPAWRMTYSNEPDTMTVTACVNSFRGNETHCQNVSNDRGSVSVTMSMKSDFGVVKGGGSENWTLSTDAGEQPPANSSFYISVFCEPGHIESSRPALLRYTDTGDEITINVSLKYRTVPEDVYNFWKERSQSLGGTV